MSAPGDPRMPDDPLQPGLSAAGAPPPPPPTGGGVSTGIVVALLAIALALGGVLGWLISQSSSDSGTTTTVTTRGVGDGAGSEHGGLDRDRDSDGNGHRDGAGGRYGSDDPGLRGVHTPRVRMRGGYAATMAAMSFRPFGSLRGYRTEWLSGDAIAGLTVWAVLVPEALAYATIAGAPPVVGLYAAPGALILYAVFGSSRHLITGPMSATAALSAAIVAQFATAGSSQFVTLTAALAITAGIVAVDRRPAAAGLRRQLHLGARAQGLHHRACPHDHRGPAAQAVRRREGQRRLLREDLGSHPAPRRHAVADAAGRGGLVRDRGRIPALPADDPGLARRGRVRRRRGLRVRPGRARRGRSSGTSTAACRRSAFRTSVPRSTSSLPAARWASC